MFQKKGKNVCLLNISNSNEQISKRFFSSENWDISKFWIQNKSHAILGGWDICKAKLGSEIDKYIFILTWTGPHSLRAALRCPDCPLSGPDTPPERPVVATCGPWGPLRVWPGQSGASRVISRLVWCCEDHLRSVWICSCLFLYPVLFCKYLNP